MADDVDFDPSQIYHYRGEGRIPENVRAGVVRVAIDPSVEEIPDRLFKACYKLKEVIFSEGLLKIGAWAFAYCRALRSFRSPSTVTEIGAYAFAGCSSLTVVELPPGLASIENMTFSGCTSLEETRIPPSVTLIGVRAFLDCINLVSIDISEGLLRIGHRAFVDCQSLRKFRVPLSLEYIGDAAFLGCRSLRFFRVPSSVIVIGGWAFHGCSSLALLRLHEGLPRLGEDAFGGCPAESFHFERLSERREAIALDVRAASELDGMLDDVGTILVRATPNARECQEILRRAHGVLTDSLREDTTTLELALWKKKIDEEAERDPRPSRQECRTNSGADMNIVIREVLTFIPSPWS